MALVKINDRSILDTDFSLSDSETVTVNTDTFDYTGNNGIQIDADSGNNAGVFVNTNGDTVKGYMSADNSTDTVNFGSITNHYVNIKQNDTTAINIGGGRVAIQNQGGDTALQIDGGGDFRLYAADAATYADIWVDGRPSGSFNNGTGNPFWSHEMHLLSQHSTYDRSWDDYPTITVHNTTDHGPQTEFRIHGAPGSSGGDISTSLRIDGSYYSGSDNRRKTNIESITSALDTVNALDGKIYNTINRDGDIEEGLTHSGKSYGFIAQDVLDVIPSAVKYDDGDADTPNENGWASAYAINYGSLVALLTNAIKEQQVIIEDLRTRIETLESAE